MIVAVTSAGTVIPPCGRCRELLWQLNGENADTTLVVVAPNETRLLRELLTYR